MCHGLRVLVAAFGQAAARVQAAGPPGISMRGVAWSISVIGAKTLMMA